MVFNFYNRLTSRQQSIYRQSDDIKRLTLRDVTQLSKITDELESFLKKEDLTQIEARCQLLADEIVRQIKSPRLKVQVLSVRPSDDWGELHGLYLPEDDGQPAPVTDADGTRGDEASKPAWWGNYPYPSGSTCGPVLVPGAAGNTSPPTQAGLA